MKSLFVALLGLGALGVFLSSCNTTKKIEAIKPLPDYSSSMFVYEKQLSTINIPVEISLLDIQNQINKTLNGLLYEDMNIEDDKVMIKVWKSAPIIVAEKSGKLHLELPMKVWLKVRYDVGGILTDEREINLNGVVKINSALSISNWHLNTKTEIEKIDWAESPSISIAGQAVPITYLINPGLGLFKGKVAQMIDANIEKLVDLKPHILGALEQVAKPMELSKEYQAWLGISPIELYMTRPVLSSNKLGIGLGLKAYLETSVGRQPTVAFDKNKIALKLVEDLKGEFTTNVAAFCTYTKASEIIQQNFAGKTFGEGKNVITINKVDIWGREGKMVVALNLSGSINGDVYVQGVPTYHAETKEITIEQMDFVLDSKERLHKLGDWFAHGLILKKIQDNCKFSVASQLSDGQKMANQYLNNYQPIKGVKIMGALNELSPNKIILTPDAIVALILAKGKVEIKIDGLF